jgi:hypothetical protein
MAALAGLVGHAQKVLRELCASPGESFTVELMEQDPSQSHHGRLRQELSTEARVVVEALIGDEFRAEGYSITG